MNETRSPLIPFTFAYILVLVIVILAWFFPKLLMRIIHYGKPKSPNSFWDPIWNFIEKPHYIWFVRILSTIAITALTLVVFLILT